MTPPVLYCMRCSALIVVSFDGKVQPACSKCGCQQYRGSKPVRLTRNDIRFMRSLRVTWPPDDMTIMDFKETEK